MPKFIEGRLSRIGEYLQREFVDPGKIAGCQVLVARDGEIGLFDQWGLADRERGTPFAEDTIVRIMSMTKPVTAVALMALFEEGLFRLDDPVEWYLPAFKGQRVYLSGAGEDMVTEEPRRKVTIRDMLRHSAGLIYGKSLVPPQPGETIHPVEQAYIDHQVNLRRDVPMMEFVERIAKVPMMYHPGEGWTYSMASDVAGALVQAISGKPFDHFLQDRIFDPLGMKDTGFNVSDDQVGRFAATYRRTENGELVLYDDPLSSIYRKPATFFGGGGGLVSTAPDYYRFCEMIRLGGELDGARILAPRTINLMLQNHLPGGADIASLEKNLWQERGNQGVGYGLGFATVFDPVASGTIADHDVYWSGFHNTLFWVDREAQLSVVFMVQFMPTRIYDFRGPLRSLAYSSLTE